MRLESGDVSRVGWVEARHGKRGLRVSLVGDDQIWVVREVWARMEGGRIRQDWKVGGLV